MTRALRGSLVCSTVIVALLLAGPGTAAERSPAPRTAAAPGLERGSFLVASRGLLDPNFSQTVVLLLDYDADGAAGLVINRPTDLTLAAVLPDLEGLAAGSVRLFVGGPVARRVVTLLIRSRQQPEDAEHIVGTVWASRSRDLLEKLGDGGGGSLRVYSGYAGWGPGQLDREIEEGGWLVKPVHEESVFHADPLGVWERLIERDSAEWAVDWTRR